MPWIESHTNIERHRKCTDCARALRIKPVHLSGHLHSLWHSVLEQQEDGDLTLWSDDAVADAALFSGAAPRFVSLLIRHGWIDDTRRVHDWLDYAGKYLIKKYNTANRPKLVEIWAKYGRTYGSLSAEVREPLETPQRPDSDSKATLTLPNLTLPSEFNSLGALAAEELLGGNDEKSFLELCENVLGRVTMVNWGGRWRKRYRENASKARRVLLAVRERKLDGTQKSVGNPGGLANHYWKTFV